jgi:hypothetical protein
MTTIREAEPTRGDSGNERGAEAERALESEIERLRTEIDAMVGELDRRRHEAFDVRLQMRRHAGLVVAVGSAAVMLALVAGAAWTSSRRRQDRLHLRVGILARAVDALSRRPG